MTDAADKLLMTSGLDWSNQEENEAEPKAPQLPWVLLHLTPGENETVTFNCVLSSLDKRSVTLGELPLDVGIAIVDASQRENTSYVVEAGDCKFYFSNKADVYLSVTGNYGMLSLTEANE